MGTVFAAIDRETGERVALKKLTRLNPLSVLRFKREFRSLADIRHPNLVRLYELEHAEDGWFLTMELIEGVELLRALHARDELAASTAVPDVANDRRQLSMLADAFYQLAQGVHAIHQAGMLHRDLKPSNVMLENHGRVVVLDFGLVRELTTANEQLSVRGTATGTPAYMPPEQAFGQELSEASDWYAYGVMLYEAVSGTLPFDSRDPMKLIARKTHDEAPPLPEDMGPADLRDLCARLLRRSATERPSAPEIFDVLSRHRPRPVRPRHDISVSINDHSIGTQMLTGHSSAELFGRDAELLQLEQALDTCIREQSGVVAHVSGPSGAGKSSLVQAFIADSVPRSFRAAAEPLVLRSRCYEREAMPFKSIDGAIDALVMHLLTLDDLQVAHLLPKEVTALHTLFPVLGRVPAVQQLISHRRKQAPADALGVRRQAEDGFRELLYNIAALRPLVIWIDDLQWGDLDSTQVLRDWLNHSAEAPMLLILSYRGDEIATSACLSQLLSESAKAERSTLHEVEIELRPLKDSDVHALCTQRSGSMSLIPPTVIARIVRGAQGNPFLAKQLTALARAKLARGEEDLTTLSVQDLVLHTSSILPPAAQQLLRVLAVAGKPLAPRIALEVAQVTSEQRAQIHELQTLRLVRTRYVDNATLLEVYHDKVRESVQASLSESERRSIFKALLRRLQAERGSEAAWLHELALGAGERDAARQYGLLAARTAAANLAFERAAELYERCVQLINPDDALNQDVAQLWKELALARVHCRKGARAAEAYLQASMLAAPAERVELQQLAASHLLRSGRFEEGEQLVQKVLAERRIRVPESELGLYAAIGWERARIAVLERVITPRADVIVPPEALRTALLYAMLALETQCYTPLRATLFQMRATRLCFQYAEKHTTARAYCLNAALVTLSADSTAAKRVDDMLERAAALIAETDDPASQLELYSARATCSMLLGRLADVIEPALAAEALYASNSAGGDLGDYFYMFVVRTAHVSALQFLGRHREAGELLERMMNDAAATDNRCAVLQATMVRTGVEQAENCCRHSRARLDLERGELPRNTLSVLHVLHVMAVMRTACLTMEHDWALAIYEELKPRYESSPLRHSAYLMCLMRVTHARLVLNHHVATHARTVPEALVDEDLKWLATKAPLPFRKPASARVRARIAAISGKRAQAAELLEMTLRLHEEIGAADEVERDRYALGLLAGPEEGATRIEAAKTALRDLGVRQPELEIHAYYPELTREP